MNSDDSVFTGGIVTGIAVTLVLWFFVSFMTKLDMVGRNTPVTTCKGKAIVMDKVSYPVYKLGTSDGEVYYATGDFIKEVK